MTEVDGDLFGVAGLWSQLMHVVSHRIHHPVTIYLEGNWVRSQSCQPFVPAWHENTLLVLGGRARAQYLSRQQPSATHRAPRLPGCAGFARVGLCTGG